MTFMSVECFLDTNVLVYAVSRAPDDAAKQARALELIQRTDFGLSAQVLQEFYVTVTCKMRVAMTPEQAMSFLDQFRFLPIAWTDYPLIVGGVEHSLRYRISFWDGAIVAAAETLGSPILYSEDFNHGQEYGSVRALNPFREA